MLCIVLHHVVVGYAGCRVINGDMGDSSPTFVIQINFNMNEPKNKDKKVRRQEGKKVRR